MAGESAESETGGGKRRWWDSLFANRTELLAALVLSASAMLTTWAGFQAALWDGEQAAAYARAGTARTEASRLATENGQEEAADLFLFSQWLNAFANDEEELQEFYRKRFQAEFRPAFEAWMALHPRENPDAPPSPFVMPQYKPPLRATAQAKEREADKLFEDGQHANDISDAFEQATVIFALALFVGGISQTFKNEKIVLGLTILAGIACLAGVVRLLGLPILRLA